MGGTAGSSKTFKILAVDGGGIRGLYSATILEMFEARSQSSIVDHFDLICGTSTGGLIALGLALGIPAGHIAGFYETRGPLIFPPRPPLVGLISQLFGGGKYSNRALRKVLQELLGDKRVGDSKALLCIPSYSITDARPYIFRFDHPEGRLGRDNKTLCVDVALATSAAPTYFPIVEIDGHPGQFVDGGVCANNPSLVGLMEAMRYFVGPTKPYDCVEVLSIETLNAPVGRPLQKRLERGALHWREELISVFMEGQARMTDFVMRQMGATAHFPCNYVRISSPPVSADQARLLALDNATPEALALLRAKGTSVANEWAVKDELVHFFRSRKTYETPRT